MTAIPWELVPLQIGFTDVEFWFFTTFMGGIVMVIVWLVRQHFNVVMPAYQRIFGYDRNPNDLGYIDESNCRFDELDEDVLRTANSLEILADNQDVLLTNQLRIAEAIGGDIDVKGFTESREEMSPEDVREMIWDRKEEYKYGGEPVEDKREEFRSQIQREERDD